VAIDNKSIIHARQAAYGVILAVQCVLSDDVRTLSLFPKLESGHRSFVTYLMRERGLLGPTQTEADAAARREAVLGDLVEGLSKRVQRT
jgi:hypothetical protein